MKKLIYTFLILFSLSIAVTGCREENKTPEEKVEETIDEIGDDLEDASDDVDEEIED